MNECNTKKWKRFIFFVCFIYCNLCTVTCLLENPMSRSVSQTSVKKVGNVRERREVKLFSTSSPVPKNTSQAQMPSPKDDSLIIATAKAHKINRPRNNKRDKAKFRILTHNMGTMKRDNGSIRPSIFGSMFLYLIMVIIIGTLFIMVVCFVHKWRENMGTNTDYPKVEYSMLRQGEDEPEDPMGEILINIGLAAPEDIRPVSDSDSEDTEEQKISSYDFENSLQESPPLEVKSSPNFTTIPLETEEGVHLLAQPLRDESDEELLQ